LKNFFLEFLVSLLEGNANGVDAVAISRWGLWGIFEDVTQVRSASAAANLDALHSQRVIFEELNRIG
jgi:hypothetical protein